MGVADEGETGLFHWENYVFYVLPLSGAVNGWRLYGCVGADAGRSGAICTYCNYFIPESWKRNASQKCYGRSWSM